MRPYPKRREDLKFSDQVIGGDRVYIIVDEESDQYFRFPEVEFGIFWDLDGETSLEAVKEKIEKQLDGAELPMDQLEGFVKDLEQKGLLESSERKPKKKQVNTLANVFYLRFKALDPERMLNAIHDPLSFVFRRDFVLLALGIIAASFTFSLFYRTEMLSQAGGLFHGGGLLVLYLSLLCVGFVHETGHALTCRHYGGRVKEMGFMLIYFQPAFYANVSDAYLFKDKYSKAAVGAGGLFFQFIFAGFAALCWYFSIPGSVISIASIAIISMSSITAFFNLNPLIKLDGYYVLGDLLEVTNLRANSFGYLSQVMKKWIWGFPEFKEAVDQVPVRLRRIYFWYGFLGFCYTFFFLGLFLKFVLRFIVVKLAMLGVLLVGAGILWGLWKWYQSARTGFLAIKKMAEGSEELSPIFNARMRLFAAIGIVLFILAIVPVRWGVRGMCEVRPEVKRPLAPLESGVVSSVLKQAGESVKKDETIAILDDFNLRRELESLKVQKQLKEAQLATLKADYGGSLTQAEGNFEQSKLALSAHQLLSPHKILESRNAMLAAEGRYLKAKTNLSTAKKEWERYQELSKEELVSPKDTEEKEAAYHSAEEELVSTDKDYQALKEAYETTIRQATITDPQKLTQDVANSQNALHYTEEKKVQIQSAEAELNAVLTSVKTDEGKLARSRIKSPIDGVIMNSRLKEFEGKMVGEGQPIGWVYEPGPMIIEIAVSEMDVSELPKIGEDGGDDVTMKILALPGASIHGKVMKIIPESMASGTGKSFLVDVSVYDKDGVMLPGMQGTAKIYGKRRSLLWQLVRRPVKYFFWKLWGLF